VAWNWDVGCQALFARLGSLHSWSSRSWVTGSGTRQRSLAPLRFGLSFPFAEGQFVLFPDEHPHDVGSRYSTLFCQRLKHLQFLAANADIQTVITLSHRS
jgi:hypothetical protein